VAVAKSVKSVEYRPAMVAMTFRLDRQNECR
jgi:hypothetical protein